MQVKAERVRDQLARPPPPQSNLLLQGKEEADYRPVRFSRPRPRNKSRASLLNPSPSFFPSAAQFSAAKRRQSERSWREQRRKFDTELTRRPVRPNSIQTAAAYDRDSIPKPGELVSYLPPLDPPLLRSSLPDTRMEDEMSRLQKNLETLAKQLRAVEEREKTAQDEKAALRAELETERKENRAALEAERRERREKEKAQQDQVAALTARIDRGKKEVRKLEEDCAYYRDRYLHLAKEAGGSRRPVNMIDEGRRGSGRPDAGTSSSLPVAGTIHPVVSVHESAAALPTRVIPASRVERDAARIHSMINRLNHNMNQMQGTVLQIGDHVARLHREDEPGEHRP